MACRPPGASSARLADRPAWGSHERGLCDPQARRARARDTMVRMSVSRGETKLPGDQTAAALISAAPALPRRERTTGLDPQSMAEFLAYDIPFATEPAVGVTFPPEVHRPAQS